MCISPRKHFYGICHVSGTSLRPKELIGYLKIKVARFNTSKNILFTRPVHQAKLSGMGICVCHTADPKFFLSEGGDPVKWVGMKKSDNACVNRVAKEREANSNNDIL